MNFEGGTGEKEKKGRKVKRRKKEGTVRIFFSLFIFDLEKSAKKREEFSPNSRVKGGGGKNLAGDLYIH